MTMQRWASRMGILMVLSLALGALAAVVWVNLVPLPSYVVRTDGHATIDERGLGSLAASDATFAVLGLACGLLLGVAAWVWFKRLGWPVAVFAAGSAILAGLTCWWLGTLVGPGPFAHRIAQAEAGDLVPVGLVLRAPSALAVWSFAAVAVPMFAASLGSEGRPAPRPGRQRRVPSPSPESVASPEERQENASHA